MKIHRLSPHSSASSILSFISVVALDNPAVLMCSEFPLFLLHKQRDPHSILVCSI